MRKINEIILHCSANREDSNITFHDIKDYHVKQRGFSDIGYHFVVDRDGFVFIGRPVERIGAHCLGHNANSIGVCYIGGLSKIGKSKDTRTREQIVSLLNLVYCLLKKYHLTIDDVHCHYEFAAKDCPCFSLNDFKRTFEFFEKYHCFEENFV